MNRKNGSNKTSEEEDEVLRFFLTKRKDELISMIKNPYSGFKRKKTGHFLGHDAGNFFFS